MFLVVFLLIASVAFGQSLDQGHIDYYNPLTVGIECNTATLQSAITAIGSEKRTLYLTATNRSKVACTWNITTDVTVPANITLWVPFGVSANISAGATLTVEGCVRSDVSNWYTGGTVIENGTCVDSTNKLLGSVLSSYVVSGCSHGVSPNTTGNISSCEAFILHPSPRLLNQVKAKSTTITYDQGDGRYWLGLRINTGSIHTGWTCPAGSMYCYFKSQNRPAPSPGLLLVQRSTVAGGIITVTRRMFSTNGVSPGKIYLTDPYIGMVCDGVTDESVKMQNAVNLSQEQGGMMLEAPAATCIFKNVLITRFEETPGGIDDNDIRHGCTSIVGQGPGQTIFKAPATVGPEDAILISSCTAFGSGQEEDGPNPAGQNPAGTLLANLSFSGNRTRSPEHHGLVLQGTYARINNVNFHYINGHALWIGRDTKLESGWINNVHIRASGRYVDDCGCEEGTATRNAAAMIFDKPLDVQRNNNVSVYGLQLGYSWYQSLAIDCTDGLNINLYFYGAMMHNHEGSAETRQGRLDSDNGSIVGIRGTCHNIVLDGFNFVAPGSDAPGTNDISAPAVPALRIDAEGAAGKPGEIILSNSYFNYSQAGKGIYIKESGRFIMNNVNFRADQWVRGQLEIEPGAFGVSDPEVQVYNRLFICNVSTLKSGLVSIAYADASAVSHCDAKTHSYRMPSDSEVLQIEYGNWTMPAGSTSLVVPHGVTCPVVGLLQPAHIILGMVSNPLACTARWIGTCCSASFTLNCNTAPGGTGTTGTYSIHIPDDCSSTQSKSLAMTSQNVTGIFTAYTQVFLQEMFYTTFNPGVTGSATDYANIIINKRKVSSIVPVAKVTTQNTSFVAWTPVKFTILDYNELLVKPGESIVVTTEKFGTGVSLNKALITVNTSPVPAIQP